MKVFVNADDFGLNHYRNLGVVYAYQKGYIDKISLIVNSKGTEEAVEYSKKYGFFNRVGLHLNITEGVPLTEKIKITKYCDKKGLFNSQSPRSLSKVFRIYKVSTLRAELEAQIIKFLNYGFPLRFIDTHNDVIFNMSFWLALTPLLKKYKIQYIRGIEPYLFGYYRKSILSYLPLKYYFKLRFLKKRIGQTFILGGGRNINQFVKDNSLVMDRRIGNLKKLSVLEIITHPELIENVCIDRTNFDENRKRYSIEDTIQKIVDANITRISIENLKHVLQL